jgi:hypothetical protein
MSDLDRIGGRTKPMSDKERELMEKHGDSLIDASNLPVPDLTRPARQDEGHCLGPDCNCARYGCEPSDCDCDLESGAANCGEHGPYKPPVRKDDSRERVAPYVPPCGHGDYFTRAEACATCWTRYVEANRRDERARTIERAVEWCRHHLPATLAPEQLREHLTYLTGE